ncbi:sensor histidine kinase [Bacillota bacterium Meth-B3]
MIAYLRARVLSIALLLAFGLIFAAVFSLYDLPLEAVGYACALCLALGVTAAALDFYAFRKRRLKYRALAKAAGLGLDALPEPRNALERDAQLVCRALQARLQVACSEGETARQQALDYYTLWVHQVKTPIAALRLLLTADEPASRTQLDAELTKIEDYAHMALTYMRLSSDATDFVIRAYPLAPIVKRAARRYAPLFIGRKIRLELMNVERMVVTDEKWLSFAVEQVLSNAVKYTPRGAVKIYLEGGALVIEDTGIGIAPEDLPRVFERSYTGLAGRTGRQSSGIGLYLSKRLLTQLKHTIEIESTVGVGTKVTIGLDTARVEWE